MKFVDQWAYRQNMRPFRYDNIQSVRCSDILEEMQVTLDASISDRSFKNRRKFIDDSVNEVGQILAC